MDYLKKLATSHSSQVALAAILGALSLALQGKTDWQTALTASVVALIPLFAPNNS